MMTSRPRSCSGGGGTEPTDHRACTSGRLRFAKRWRPAQALQSPALRRLDAERLLVGNQGWQGRRIGRRRSLAVPGRKGGEVILADHAALTRRCTHVGKDMPHKQTLRTLLERRRNVLAPFAPFPPIPPGVVRQHGQHRGVVVAVEMPPELVNELGAGGILLGRQHLGLLKSGLEQER